MCLEGAWNDDDLADRTSVLPLLDLLQRAFNVKYVHRDVATETELMHYLGRWVGEGAKQRILYLASHGGSTGISLSTAEDGEASLSSIADVLEGALPGRIVYFGACSVMSAEDEALADFLGETGADAIIGYNRTIDWMNSAALDFIALGTLARYRRLSSALKHLDNAPEYKGLRDALGFRILPTP